MIRTRRIAAVERPHQALHHHSIAVSIALLFAALLLGTVLLVMLPVALLPVALGAQAPATPLPANTTCDRCIAGHRYLVSSLAPDPFITTHFRNSLGGGFASGLDIPSRDIDSTVVDTVNHGIGFVTLDLEFQYAATRWLGLRAGTSINARVGTSARALVASGAEALRGLGIGLTGRVWGSPKVLVSLTGDYRSSQVYLVDPYSFAQKVEEDGGLSSEARDLLLRTARLDRFTAGVRGAWTIAPWVGLNGVAEFGTADDPRPDNEGTTSVSEFGLAAGFDFAQRARQVPVGLTLAARRQGGMGQGAGLAGNSTAFALGLFYTGRPHFLVGSEVTWSRIDVEQPSMSNLDATQFRLISRYDF